MKRNKQNERTKNGITLNGEVYTGFKNKVYSNFGFFRLFLVIITALCSIFMFTSGIELEANFLLLTICEVAFACALCSLKSKKTLVKAGGIISISLISLSILLTFKSIIRGFQFIINDYLDAVEAGKLFNNLRMSQYDICINFALVFLLFLVTIGLCISLYYKSSFLGVFFLTFPFFELVAYWGLVPNYLTFFVILAVWFISMCMQNSSQVKVKYSETGHYSLKGNSNVFYPSSKDLLHSSGAEVSVFSAVLSCIILIIVIVLALFLSERPDSVKSARRTIKNAIENFSVEDIPLYLEELTGDFEIFPDKKFGTTDGGKLGQDAEIDFKNVRALEIELYGSDFPDSSIYLKGYVAGNYTGDSWKQLDEDLYYDDYEELFDSNRYGLQDYSSKLVSSYYGSQNSISGNTDNYLRTITIKNLNASKKYLYTPYLADYGSISSGKTYLDTYVLAKEKTYSVDYFNVFHDDAPFMNVSGLQIFFKDDELNEYRDFVYENYTDFKGKNISEAYNTIINDYMEIFNNVYSDAVINGDIPYDEYLEIIDLYKDYDSLKDGFINIPNYFSNGESNYAYAFETASAIQQYFDNNFKYTLAPGKTPSDEDFVEYFLEEQKEGYCTYFASAGTLLMRAFGFPARYVEGFVATPDEFNADGDSVKAVITDKSAHAWCEVFIDNVGWVAVEFTPGYDEGVNPNNNYEEHQTTTTTKSTSTTPKTTTTKKPTQSSTKATSQSIAGAVTTASTTTRASENSGNKTDYDRIIMIVVIILLIVFVVLLSLYIWNRIYISKRKKLMKSITDSDRSFAVTSLYKQCVELFGFIGIVDDSFKTDIENCSYVFEKINAYGIEISQLDFEVFTELAVEADMSINPISEEAYDFARGIYESVSLQIYEKLSSPKKLYAKYFKFLY